MKNIEDVELIWLDDEEADHIYSNFSVGHEFINNAQELKLDVLVGYRKTALSEVVNYFMKEISCSENSASLKKLRFLLSNILLLAVYPKAAKVKFSKRDEFRDIIELIKDDYGDQYIEKSDLYKIPEHAQVIRMLLSNGLLLEETDRYTVVDYYLKNLKVSDKKPLTDSNEATQADPSPDADATEQDSEDTAPKKYDVFLCHNSIDKPAVKEIARRLQEHGIVPWLDEWEIRPGAEWQGVLEEQIDTIHSVAVFIGTNGIGPWQDLEKKAFLQQFQKRNSPIIPVILSGPSGHITTPTFLNLFQRVDFRETEPDPMEQLIWGITGKRPKNS
jgi:hypothetical protein